LKTIALLSMLFATIFAASAEAVVPAWKNCANVNKRYPHGVGKVGARDKTTGTPRGNECRIFALGLYCGYFGRVSMSDSDRDIARQHVGGMADDYRAPTG